MILINYTYFTKLVLISFLFFLISNSSLFSQSLEEGSTGKIYIISFPQIRSHTFIPKDQQDILDDSLGKYMPPLQPSASLGTPLVHIYSAVDQTIIIKKPNDSVINLALTGKSFTIFTALFNGSDDTPAFADTAGEVLANRSIRIESTYPIVVYCEITGTNGAEVWTPVPAESWGNEYYLASAPDDALKGVVEVNTKYNYKNDDDLNVDFVYSRPVPAPAEAVVTALDSGTDFQYIPTYYYWSKKDSSYFPYEKVTKAKLEMNDAYLIQSNADTVRDDYRMKNDIAGTRIISNKPIGVISGNTRSSAGFKDSDIHGMLKNTFKNLLMESLTPINAQGTEFVFAPVYDNKLPKQPISDYPSNGLLRLGELVRIYGTSNDTTKILKSEIISGPTFVVNSKATPASPFFPQEFGRDGSWPFIKTIEEGVLLKTDKPSQAFVTPLPVYTGPKTSEAFIDVTFLSRATFMCEITPREQWISFAPFYKAQYINIITDSIWKDQIEVKFSSVPGRPAKLNLIKAVPGTRYVWGTILLDAKFAGSPGFIQGSNGAKFAAYCYGFSDGSESRQADPVNGNYNYNESTATAYGYPVAPSRLYLASHDSVEIKTFRDECSFMIVEAKIVNPKPSGFRSINIENDTNVAYSVLVPDKYFRVIGANFIRFTVRPKNIRVDAVADIVITDRTGYKWKVKYSHQGFKLDMIPNKIDFDSTKTAKPFVTIKNNSYKTIVVKQLGFRNAVPDFELDTIIPSNFPDTLKPGESMKVQVTIYPTDFYKNYKDNLVVVTDCDTFYVPLNLSKLKFPCIYIDDLDFGTIPPGKLVKRYIDICNLGEGILHFRNITPPGKSTFEFPNGGEFFIDPIDLLSLQNITLVRGECKKVGISFVSDTLRFNRVKAKCYSNAITCQRDTPIFYSKVIKSAPAITGTDFGGQLTTYPLSNCAKNKTPSAQNIFIWNTSNGPFTVSSFELLGQDAKDSIFRFAKKPRPAIEIGDIIRGEDTSADNKRFQEILFYPKDEKFYSCRARLTTTAGDTVETLIQGKGITAHIAINDFDFGLLSYKGLYYNDYITITALPSHPLRITGIELKGDPEISLEPLYKKPTPKDPIDLNVGDIYQVPIRFKSNTGGIKSAIICVSSNLHSYCDDSCATILARIPDDQIPQKKSDATLTGLSFKEILTCNTDTGSVVLTNTGEVPLTIKKNSIVLTSDVFVVGLIQETRLSIGQKLKIPIKFIPNKAQTESTIMFVDCFDSSGNVVVVTASSNITGKSKNITAETKIDKYFNGVPSDSIIIPITLTDDIVSADVKSLIIEVNYEPNSILLSNYNDSNKYQLLKGTILQGWDIKILSIITGKMKLELNAPQGQVLHGKGTLVNLKYNLFLSEKLNNQISYTIEQNLNKCVSFSTTKSLVLIDTVCGGKYRLIDLTNSNYTLNQNHPNPFNPSTEILFSLGLDGLTKLEIFNSIGEKLLTLINENLESGNYKFTFDGSSLPSGLYYYKLTSGVYSKTKPMILQK